MQAKRFWAWSTSLKQNRRDRQEYYEPTAEHAALSFAKENTHTHVLQQGIVVTVEELRSRATSQWEVYECLGSLCANLIKRSESDVL